jgi:hypothetical protein
MALMTLHCFAFEEDDATQANKTFTNDQVPYLHLWREPELASVFSNWIGYAFHQSVTFRT